jgi:hypothetical protein
LQFSSGRDALFLLAGSFTRVTTATHKLRSYCAAQQPCNMRVRYADGRENEWLQVAAAK